MGQQMEENGKDAYHKDEREDLDLPVRSCSRGTKNQAVHPETLHDSPASIERSQLDQRGHSNRS